MPASEVSTLIDAAGNLTVISLLLIFIFLLLRGDIITRNRFQDWIGLVEYERKRADEVTNQLKDMIDQYEKIIDLLQAIQTYPDRHRGNER